MKLDLEKRFLLLFSDQIGPVCTALSCIINNHCNNEVNHDISIVVIWVQIGQDDSVLQQSKTKLGEIISKGAFFFSEI